MTIEGTSSSTEEEGSEEDEDVQERHMIRVLSSKDKIEDDEIEEITKKEFSGMGNWLNTLSFEL